MHHYIYDSNTFTTVESEESILQLIHYEQVALLTGKDPCVMGLRTIHRNFKLILEQKKPTSNDIDPLGNCRGRMGFYPKEMVTLLLTMYKRQ